MDISKKDLQKYINKLILMYEYAKEDGELTGLSNEEITALQIAVTLLQEQYDSKE